MPPKMKTKPTVGVLSEGNGLQPCRHSIKISKSTRFDVKKCPEVFLEASIVNQNEASNSFGTSVQAVTRAETSNHEQLQAGGTLELTSCVERSVSLPSMCPSVLETLFSPFMESDIHCQPAVSSSTVTNEGEPDAAADESDEGSSSSSSCEYHNCDGLILSSSDQGVAIWSFDENAEIDNLIASCPSPGYMTVDMERYMTLPLLEESVETGNLCDGESVDEAVVNSDECLYLAIHQMKPPDSTVELGFCSGDLDDLDDFDPQLFIRNLPDLSEIEPNIWPTLLPKERQKKKSVTLVLDLDETLVHSTLDHCEDADFTFPVHFNMKEHIVYVRRRPYLHVFLERVAEMFEVIVFTASQSLYAEQLLDILDPDQRLISQRFYRESCIFSDGGYTKDLSVLGLDLSKVVIVDNSPQVFRLQVNNGIPIQSWFDDLSDSALISLLPFLETLADANDVRPIIAERFNP